MTDLNGNIDIGKGFIDVIEQINPKDLQKFKQYVVVKRALHSWVEPANGKPKRVWADDTLHNPEELKQFIKTAEKENTLFKEVSEDLYKFKYNVMKNFLVESGGMTQETLDRLTELDPYHVPFYRNVNKEGKGVKSTFANQKTPIYKAKGSGLEILDPIESILLDTAKYVKFGMRNNVMKTIAQWADETEGIGHIIEAVPPDMVKSEVNISGQKELFKERLEQRLSKNNTDDIAERLDDVSEVLDEVFAETISKWSPVVKGGKNIVSVLVDGKPKYYQVHDELLYKAIATLTPQELNWFCKISQAIMRPMKTLITSINPLYAMTQPIRQQEQTYKYGSVTNPVKYFANYGKAFIDEITKSEDYKRYRAMGGGYSSELSSTRDPMKKVVHDLKHRNDNKIQQVLHGLWHWQDKVAWLNNFMETAPRLAEFKNVLEKTGDTQEAIYKADDVGTNYKRSGPAGRALNAVFIYNNSVVQGTDKVARVVNDAVQSARKGDSKPMQAVVFKFIIMAILVESALYWLNSQLDKKGYENLSGYMKTAHRNIPLGNSKFLRMPKSRETSMFDVAVGSAIEYAFGGNKDAFRDFGGYIANNVIPPMIPTDLTSIPDAIMSPLRNTVTGPFLDIAVNKDFKGVPIVPGYMKNLEKFEQYDEKTSAAAYHLGQIMNWSPKEIDHVLSGYFGIAARMNNALFPLEGGDSTPADILTKPLKAIETRFTADSNYSTDILNRTYDARDKTKTAYARNPTGENAIKHEKWAMMVSYISNINKMANDLPADERREARGELLEIIKNWNIKFNETDRKIINALPKDTTEGKYIVTSLPPIKLERTTVNGTKQYYTMTAAEYGEYIDDYRKELEKERKKALASANLSPEKLSERLDTAKSKASSTVKKRYENKHFRKFKKAG